MFKKLFKKLNSDKIRQADEYQLELSTELSQTVKSIRDIISESSDVVEKEIKIGHTINSTLFYFDGLCNTDILEDKVIKPLTSLPKEEIESLKDNDLLNKLSKEVITLSSVSICETFDEAILPLMTGNTLLIIDGLDKLLILATQGFDKRGIEEPQSEVVIRGPRDGFVETLQTNIVLLRRRIADPNLIVQTAEIGRRSKKKICIAYIKGITNQDLVEEVRYRLSCIDTDQVQDTGTLEQLIEDNVLSPFPQMMYTERPDKTTAALMNGQVVLMVDGTPYALIAPITFNQLLKSPEDYYERWQIGTLIRLVRYVASFIALFLPSLYIAMVTFHQGMLPTTLTLGIAGTRAGVPFPAFFEALLMEATIELLREAGIRLPRAIGQTIGIVGGLVIGDAAVRAGFVSPVMVIVVAVTAIASFAIPVYSFSIALRMLRFGMMIGAAIFGLYGIIIIYIFINIHLVGLRSFGSYYTSPFAPYRYLDWLDLLYRAPLSMHKVRTDEPVTLDDKKQK